MLLLLKVQLEATLKQHYSHFCLIKCKLLLVNILEFFELEFSNKD